MTRGLRVTRKSRISKYQLPNTNSQKLSPPKRILQRRALRREQLRSVFGDVHVVFQTHTELAANINAGLVAETHIRGQQLRVAPDKIRPLVAVHADAVAQTMGEVLVIG